MELEGHHKLSLISLAKREGERDSRVTERNCRRKEGFGKNSCAAVERGVVFTVK